MSEVREKAIPAAETTVSASPTTSVKKAEKATGLTFRRFFTKPGVSPYDEVEWERRTALITDAQGTAIFEQKDVEVPKDWSVTATNIVASKYLHGQVGTPERESGVRALVTRVAETIRNWGLAQGYFRTTEDGATFHDELVHILIRQYAAFNSPVWFNVGCDRIEPNSDAQNWHWNPTAARVEFGVTGYSTPQCSACFINSVKDSLDSILTLAKTEGMLFKWGSGTGTNLSSLRSSTEGLSGGGTASGPLSFMKGFDAFAGVIKSGGKTRRAAKMVILNIDHPDIIDFIECKSKEEAKAHALVAAGFVLRNPRSLLEELFSYAQGQKSGFGEKLVEFEQRSGINVLSDLAGPLGTDVAFAIDGPIFPVPSWEFVMEVYGPDRLQWTIEKLIADFNNHSDAKLTLAKENTGGRTLYTLTSQTHPNLEVHYCDLTNHPDFAPFANSMDTVICLNVLEHIGDDALGLQNIYSILDHGGRAISSKRA